MESELGVGSTFFFTMPLHQAQPETKPTLTCERERQPAPASAATLLVVDDDPAVCAFLSQTLEAEGYAVLTAHSGQEALKLASTHLPRLITMDLLMPGMDGTTAIRHLRENPLTRHIPVVVISAVLESYGNPTVGGGQGSDAALSKPVDEAALLRTVHGLLGESGAMAKQCLIINACPLQDEAHLVRLCSGNMQRCKLEEVWSEVEKGFKGAVVLSSSAGNELDLPRLAQYPDIMVIVIPD